MLHNTVVGFSERMLFRALMVDVVQLMVLNVLIANQDVHLKAMLQNTVVGFSDRMLFRALMVDVVQLMVLNVLIAKYRIATSKE